MMRLCTIGTCAWVGDDMDVMGVGLAPLRELYQK